MIVSIIVAVSENGVIGKDNAMPWHLPADMHYFRKITTGHHVIMGRKNKDAMGKALPHRTNIVITRNNSLQDDGFLWASSLNEALEIAEKSGEEECFVIGGAEIYRLALPVCAQIYLTKVHGEFDGDVFFPKLGPKWKESWREDHQKDEKNLWDWSYTLYTPS